ncbi:hypothetical protein L6R50_26150 [Myxococcota bacterium]|nr:hypothetical protein [Myxococcota bacterium]
MSGPSRDDAPRVLAAWIAGTDVGVSGARDGLPPGIARPLDEVAAAGGPRLLPTDPRDGASGGPPRAPEPARVAWPAERARLRVEHGDGPRLWVWGDVEEVLARCAWARGGEERAEVDGRLRAEVAVRAAAGRRDGGRVLALAERALEPAEAEPPMERGLTLVAVVAVEAAPAPAPGRLPLAGRLVPAVAAVGAAAALGVAEGAWWGWAVAVPLLGAGAAAAIRATSRRAGG